MKKNKAVRLIDIGTMETDEQIAGSGRGRRTWRWSGSQDWGAYGTVSSWGKTIF